LLLDTPGRSIAIRSTGTGIRRDIVAPGVIDTP
jgi:hypothetical protein